MKNILVLGFFHKKNAGDQFFIEAFQELFPGYKFTFVDQIEEWHLNSKIDAIFIGGGSFLLNTPPIGNLLNDILKFKIFYISVGAETNIHPVHQQLMAKAELIAIRTPQFLNKIKLINQKTILIPDIVYSLISIVKPNKPCPNSVLIASNQIVVPQNHDPLWKYNSWLYFKSEFSQFLDELIDNGNSVTFVSMCSNKNDNDEWASIEIANSMKNRHEVDFINGDYDLSEWLHLFSCYERVITQRYHGIVLSEMTNTPYVVLYHHDKLKTAYPSRGNFVNYYGLNKALLRDNFNSLKKFQKLPIESNSFDELVASVRQKIGE